MNESSNAGPSSMAEISRKPARKHLSQLPTNYEMMTREEQQEWIRGLAEAIVQRLNRDNQED